MSDISPHARLRAFSDFSADIDLVVTGFANGARSIFVTDAGDGTLSIIDASGTTVALTGVTVGLLEPSPTWIRKINAAGTGIGACRIGW